MTGEIIAKALGGRKAGGSWMARCPVHDDRQPSLSIRDGDDGKVVVHCHAGCDQDRVIAALKGLGIWSAGGRDGRIIGSQSRATNKLNRGHAKRTEAALGIWEAAAPAGGTLVETYLRARGIGIPMPATLRFHPAIKHPSGQRWPAMIALVMRGADGAALAIHRTFLARGGYGKAMIEPAKMMLGPCRGGAVRLGPIGDRLMIAEGIETALSVMQATGRAACAALSTSGLRTLELPAEVRDVVVLADGDEPGETAARDAAHRWLAEGRCVRIALPPFGFDFNDVLTGRAKAMIDEVQHVAAR
jgi:putative DNA primase/helicase